MTRKHLLPLLVLRSFTMLVAAVAWTSCASQQSPASPTTALVASPPSFVWAELSGEEKGKIMKEIVMPKTKALFAEYNAEKYADVKCSLCHGANPKERGFKMPAPDLPPFEMSMFEDHPDMAMFMKDKVIPMVASALNLKPFDGQSGDVRCTTCHPTE